MTPQTGLRAELHNPSMDKLPRQLPRRIADMVMKLAADLRFRADAERSFGAFATKMLNDGTSAVDLATSLKQSPAYSAVLKSSETVATTQTLLNVTLLGWELEGQPQDE